MKTHLALFPPGAQRPTAPAQDTSNSMLTNYPYGFPGPFSQMHVPTTVSKQMCEEIASSYRRIRPGDCRLWTGDVNHDGSAIVLRRNREGVLWLDRATRVKQALWFPGGITPGPAIYESKCSHGRLCLSAQHAVLSGFAVRWVRGGRITSWSLDYAIARGYQQDKRKRSMLLVP